MSDRLRFLGCAMCSADISAYNMVDTGAKVFVCLRCVLGSLSFKATESVFVATPVALNLAWASAPHVSLRVIPSGPLCTEGYSCRCRWSSCGDMTWSLSVAPAR